VSGYSFEPTQDQHAADGGIFHGAGWMALPFFPGAKYRNKSEEGAAGDGRVSWMHVIDTAQLQGPVMAYAPEMVRGGRCPPTVEHGDGGVVSNPTPPQWLSQWSASDHRLLLSLYYESSARRLPTPPHGAFHLTRPPRACARAAPTPPPSFFSSSARQWDRRIADWCEMRESEDASWNWTYIEAEGAGKCVNPNIWSAMGSRAADWYPSVGGEIPDLENVSRRLRSSSSSASASSDCLVV